MLKPAPTTEGDRERAEYFVPFLFQNLNIVTLDLSLVTYPLTCIYTRNI
jgi:hypothetical protein